jgi:hypothetical protein
MKKFITILVLGFFLLSGLGSFSTTADSNENYDLIIISPTNFIEKLQPLIDHKESHSVPTIVVTLDEIYNSFYFPVEGRDDAEKIKYFIKNSIENWNAEYVMLVGGKEVLPVRYSKLQLKGNLEFKLDHLLPDICSVRSSGFITDLYYADVYDENDSFCCWDSNNNSVFGEIGSDGAIDAVDLYPDIYIGRILCQNPEEVEIVVGKIIDYENNAYDQEWFNNLILCGGDTHPNTWEEILLAMVFKNMTGMRYRIAWEGEYMCNEVAKCLNSFNAKKYYSSGLLGIRAKRLTNRNINKAINDGAGFVLFSMHGSPTKLVTHPPFNKKRSIQIPFPNGYNISGVEKLTNNGKLPIAVFAACSNGDFDTVPSPIAWEFVKNSNGGAIASFALTTEGNIYPTTMYTESLSGHTTMSVFEAYNDGIDILGKIWGETINRYLDDDIAWSISENLNSNGDSVVWLNFLALEEWILFGDPSLKIGGYQ